MNRKPRRAHKATSVPIDKVKRWLKQSQAGRRILGELVGEAVEEKCRECELREKQSRVLVLVHPDWRIEVFAPKNVLVHIQGVLQAENEVAAEDQAVDSLPGPYREAWNSCVRSTTACCKPRTIQDEVNRLLDLWFLHILQGKEQ